MHGKSGEYRDRSGGTLHLLTMNKRKAFLTIRKLEALGDGSRNPNKEEAALARQKALELRKRFGLVITKEDEPDIFIKVNADIEELRKEVQKDMEELIWEMFGDNPPFRSLVINSPVGRMVRSMLRNILKDLMNEVDVEKDD